MPRCSGMQVSSYDKESIEKNTGLLQNIDTHASMMLKILEELYADMKKSLPASLTAWSKNQLCYDKYVFVISSPLQNLNKILNSKT